MTNNLLSLTYRNENNELITFRKNITDFLDIDKGDYLTSSNIKDSNSDGGFAKISKALSKRKSHFGKSTVNVSWDDLELDNKYNTMTFTDSNGISRQVVRLPCLINT